MLLRWLVPAVAVWVCSVSAAGATPPREDDAEAMVDAVNAARVQHGLPTYRHHPALSRSSAAFADYLMRNGIFGHADRIRAGGSFRRLGEALAWHRGGRPQVRDTVRRWLASPSHRALVLADSFRWAGAGRVSGRSFGGRGTIWVLQLGHR